MMRRGIEQYALIGDCETAALVSRNGSIDWLCLPRFDSPACFAALLGSEENGRWSIAPRQRARVSRRYRPHTLILETEFRTSTGQATLFDFMPVRETSPRVIRIIRGDHGTVHLHMDLVMRFDYGLTVPWVTRDAQGSLIAIAGPHRLSLHSSITMEGKDFHTVSDFSVKAGQEISFQLEYAPSVSRRPSATAATSWLNRTEQFWRKWTSMCRYHGPHAELVERSLITLKALIFAPTGGIVAAPTTSLPERPGGPLNWDYRYCWLRDATFTLLGFHHAGYRKEARRWRDWLIRSAAGSADQLQVLYSVTGERLLHEWNVAWLSGFENSLPVRIGNAAGEQLQLDIYGELADALFQDRPSTKTGVPNFDLQFALIEHLRKVWRGPDHGIWEIRGKKHQFTHSKVMAWVAFDRTIRIVERFHLKAPVAEWCAVRQQIHDQVCRHGFDSQLGTFVQYYGSKEVDASLVILPLVGFLPPTDPRVVGTIRRIEKDLLRDGLVFRYRTLKHRTLMTIHEGVFLPCSFWLADYYELAGDPASAKRLLQRLLQIPNDVGLLAEEYDTRAGRQLGNFPQALSHVALINTVINIYQHGGPAHQRANHRGTVGPP